MKKILIPSFLAIVLGGCSGGAFVSPPPITDAQLTVEITDTVPDSEKLSDCEVERLLEGRRFIHTFGIVDCLSFDYGEQVRVDEKVYCKVTDKEFLKWEDWKNFVNSIYTEELSKDILKTAKLIDHKGDLYTGYWTKCSDLPKKCEFEITESSANETVIRQTYNDFFDENKVFVDEITLLLTNSGWRIVKIYSFSINNKGGA